MGKKRDEFAFAGYYSSPIGLLKIDGDDQFITSIHFLDKALEEDEQYQANDLIQDCINQLKEYFEGHRKEFDLALNPAGTEFQQHVWGKVSEIPYGETTSYGLIAKLLGDQKFSRAVGLANGANPIPIIIPCHRVIGNDGSLTGYAGGLDRKKWLLNHEQSHSKVSKGQYNLF